MEKEKRMKWWAEARFGMFIHWGLYAIPARGEWVMLVERIARDEYKKLSRRFKPPVKFSPEEWVKTARDAGMKYMVFTTRHHDGFCLFDSRASDFTSVKTAAKRDFVKEYVAACRKHKMRIGFYYSLLDWRFPGYFDRKKYPESFKAMVVQAHEQVRELMTNYGKIDILWYDGGWIPGTDIKKDTHLLWKSRELNSMARKLQPHIVINNRSGLPEDTDTPEQHTTPSEEGRYWESCMTMGDSYGWGYIRNNPNMKPATQLIQNLVDCSGSGGNYLLNIGPKADGSIRKEEIARLREIGVWLKKNGKAVYGSERTAPGFARSLIGTVTSSGKNAYLHIFRWPGKTAVFSSIKNKIISAKILADGRDLKFEQQEGRLIITGLPEKPPDKYGTVIALELKGKPEPFDYTKVPLK